MRRAAGLLSCLFAAALAAQSGPPAFVPDRQHVVYELTVEDIPALLAQWRQTRAGRLLAEPDAAEAFATALAHHRERKAARHELAVLAEKLGCVTSSTIDGPSLVEVEDLRRITMSLAMQGDEISTQSGVVQYDVKPQVEGRLARSVEQYAARLARMPDVETVADAKLGGLPIQCFREKPQAGQDPAPDEERFHQPDRWLAHFPGTFLYGIGKPELAGTLGTATAAPAPAGIHLGVALTHFFALTQRAGPRIGAELQAIGIDAAQRLDWRLTVDGELLRDSIRFEMQDKPSGVLAAVLQGKAALPAQPLPAGAMLQLRLGVDLAVLFESLAPVLPDEALPEALRKDMIAGFTGGLAIGVAAPAPGGVIPRLFLTLAVADRDAALRVLTPELGLPTPKTKAFEHDGIACTTIASSHLPPGFQPSWCLHDGVLQLAESAASLRALLQAQKAGGEAMDVGSAAPPAGEGDVLPTFDLRWDEAASYRAFRDLWLPFWELAPLRKEPGFAPLLERDDLPRPSAVQDHLGKGRGVLRRHGNTFALDMLGTVGGPELFALGITWGPILSGWMLRDWTGEHLAAEVAKKQLEVAFTALSAHKQAKGSWPQDLGELFAASKLADDALLLPGDKFAEAVPVPGTPQRLVQSSFRYFPQGVDQADGSARVLLIAIAPWDHARPMLAEDGSTPECWGEASRQPIDAFGRRAKK